MTEAEWWSERRTSQFMLRFLQRDFRAARSKIGRRKLRLLACGSCRLIWQYIKNPTWRKAVEASELFADGLATKDDLAFARESISGRLEGSYLPESPLAEEHTIASMVHGATEPQPASAAFYPTAFPMALAGFGYGKSNGDEALCELLRCIFSNMVRPVTLDPRWLSSTVLDLARTIYDERAFERLPILADALMDAGCDSDEVVNHCRSDGPHVRGCWVVDLILGKE